MFLERSRSNGNSMVPSKKSHQSQVLSATGSYAPQTRAELGNIDLNNGIIEKKGERRRNRNPRNQSR